MTSFTMPGTYTITITEVPGILANVTYDTHAYIVTYEVTDTKGRLAATLTSGNEPSPVPHRNPAPRRNPDPRRSPVRRPDRPATAGPVPVTGDENMPALGLALAVGTAVNCAVWQMR